MEQVVRIAHHVVLAGEGQLVTVGLGSCVAITVHDPLAKIAGLAHVLLPDVPANRMVENRAKYASTAVPLLLEEMRALGATGPFVGKLAGGARIFGDLLGDHGTAMGPRNVDAARSALAAARVRVAAEDVGGDSGRRVSLDVVTGAVTVSTVRGGTRVL